MSPLPTPAVNIQLGIGDTIRAVKEILEKPQEAFAQKQDETLSTLRQQLEVILKIVTQLESMFTEILRGFRNDDILRDPKTLKEHLDQTNIFLESRELLQYLDPAIGSVEAATFSKRLEGEEYHDLVKGLRDLRRKLDLFRTALGRSGRTGPGLPQLMQLCYLADQQLKKSAPPDPKIPKVAEEALDKYDWALSSDIRKLIGRIVILS